MGRPKKKQRKIWTPPHEKRKADVKRNARGHWLKGQSANPGGRVKGSRSLTTLFHYSMVEMFDDKPAMQIIIEKVRTLAFAGERWAAELCMEYGLGKPAQTVRTGPIEDDFSDIPPEQFDLAVEVARQEKQD